MAQRYLLSNGRSTYRVEYYIMDLLKMYLIVYPGDIPGAAGIGYDFTITNTMKSDLADSVYSKVSGLITVISARFSNGIQITLDSVTLLSETKAKVVITVNNLTDEIELNLIND